MKTKINLRISEIPSIIGYNPYANIKQIVLRIWEKANQEDYYTTSLNLVQKNIIDSSFIKDEDVIAHHSRKYNIDFNTQLEVCKTAESTKELKVNANNILNAVEDNKNISKSDKKVIQNSLHNLTKTNYGQQQENAVVLLYSQIHKMKVRDQQKYVRKKIAFSELYEWHITGRVDGIREDNTLVEVKNRVNKLFMTLKPYENIQVQIYLHLLKLKKGHLVECYKHNDETEMNVIEVAYDTKIWKEIKKKIEIFINFFYLLMQTPEIKYLFLTGTESQINKYYDNYCMTQLIMETNE